MIEVLHAGLCDLVMDQGRPGSTGGSQPVGGQRLGGGGAGNHPERAKPAVSAGGVVALTGARFAAMRSSGAALAWNETLVLAAGETLNLERAETGCRCGLALRGGLVLPQVMGSRSTFLPAGFGGHLGRALRAGDRLASGTRAGGVRLLRARAPSHERDARLRVVAGPQAGQFDDAGLLSFFAGNYRVGAASDRRGLRLSGPAATHAQADLPSQGVLPVRCRCRLTASRSFWVGTVR